MSKLIMVSEFISANDNSTGYFWSSLIRKLSTEFSECIVISPDIIDNCDSVFSVKVKSMNYDKNKIVNRVLFQTLQSLQFTFKILMHVRKEDTVIVGTNPTMLLFFLPMLKKAIGFNWVLLVYDIIPENLVPAGIIKKESVSFKLLNKYFSFVYSRPDKVISIGSDMRDLIVKKCNIEPSKIDIIQNWVNHNDVKLIKREKNSVFKKMNFKESDFVFTFFGNLGRVQGIPNILEASKHIVNDNIKILFIGDGYFKEELTQFVNNNTKDNVFYYGSIPQEQKDQGLSAGDVALVTLADGMLGLGVPSKSYFSMAADKPILSVMDENAEVSMMVRKHNIGWLCRPNAPKELAKCFDNIYSERYLKQQQKPRKVLVDFYSEEVALGKFVTSIRNVHKSR